MNAGITTAVVCAVIAFANTVTFLFTIDMLPRQLGTWLLAFADEPHELLAMTVVILILVGIFIEPAPAYIMLVPIFMPIIAKTAIDPIHFAIVFIFTLCIGVLTPPVGALLFVLCGMTGITMNQLWKPLWPFICIQYGVCLIAAMFPGLVLFVPRLLGYPN